MKTVAANIEIQRGGVQAETAFTIKATSKAFDILSSGLYSDKIRAIVRELSCNAYDSHVGAGKADRPIEVKLPTSLDQTFYVKDFGTGLSHEDIIQIYTTYFESTKTESDDFIGQLGLGSKSPFSYAPTFTVESRFNGTKRVYTCFKNEQGMPAISLMGEANTDEENGVTVSLAVKYDDIDKFNDAARKVFMYFNPKPDVKGGRGFEPYALSYTVSGTNWKIRNTGYGARMEGPYVIQGLVAYPLDASMFHDRGLTPAALKVLRTNLDLFVDIGQVEVAASRESLSYDLRTINNLIKVLETVALEMRDAFEKEFVQCKTTWEAAQKLDKLSNYGDYELRAIFDSMHRATPFQWNGVDIERNFELDLSNIMTTTIRRMSTVGGKASVDGAWTPDNMTKKTTITARHDTVVIVDTEAKGFRDVVTQYMKASGHGYKTAVYIAPTSKKLYSQQEVDSIIDQLKGAVVVKVADVPIVRTKNVSTYKKRTAEQKMVWTGFREKEDYRGRAKILHRVFSKQCWSTEQVVLEDGGFYIDVDRFTPIHDSPVVLEEFDQILTSAIELGMIDADTKVYGMNSIDKKHIANINEWVNIIDHIKQQFDLMNTNFELYNRMMYEQIKTDVPTGVMVFFVDDDQYFDALADGPFKSAIEVIRSIKSSAKHGCSRQAIGRLIDDKVHVVPSTISLYKKTSDVVNDYRHAVDKYGMLSLINWSCVSSYNIDTIVDYINVVDQQ